jgi:hypothetical protein
MRWDSSWVVGVWVLAGCAQPRHLFPDESGAVAAAAPIGSPAVIVTPGTTKVGTIASVNPASRFVVITYPLGVALPAIERKLDVYRSGLKVAEVRITGPSRDLNTVADILAGECQPGDEVRGD